MESNHAGPKQWRSPQVIPALHRLPDWLTVNLRAGRRIFKGGKSLGPSETNKEGSWGYVWGPAAHCDSPGVHVVQTCRPGALTIGPYAHQGLRHPGASTALCLVWKPTDTVMPLLTQDLIPPAHHGEPSYEVGHAVAPPAPSTQPSGSQAPGSSDLARISAGLFCPPATRSPLNPEKAYRV
ncbi:hypothetical protein NDU88_000516 [Pleurodeles waltl]|uniref:Uncharacterized protein n=1 Tax=Pleurodeles waltl TaxID=8319 RepID=A0AAV7UQ75_PLEWA|nr:hypothetical protein NDU88_000516 [Pleurodeles waltl]